MQSAWNGWAEKRNKKVLSFRNKKQQQLNILKHISLNFDI